MRIRIVILGLLLVQAMAGQVINMGAGVSQVYYSYPDTINSDTMSITSLNSERLYADTIKADTVSTDALYTKRIHYEPPHSYMTFKDSAVVITGGTTVQVTNAYDSLYRVINMVDITHLKGDTVQFDEDGYYNVFVSIRGYGGNGADWQMTRASKRGSTVTYGNSTVDFTTTGATNRNGGFMMYVVDVLAGDKLYFVLSRMGGSGDFTIVSSTWKVQQYFKR